MERGKKKVLDGVVVSNKMQKTVTVKVERKLLHPEYQKAISQVKKFYAHDETGKIAIGQKVRIMETRPLSRTKRWRVVEVLEG